MVNICSTFLRENYINNLSRPLYKRLEVHDELDALGRFGVFIFRRIITNVVKFQIEMKVCRDFV